MVLLSCPSPNTVSLLKGMSSEYPFSDPLPHPTQTRTKATIRLHGPSSRMRRTSLDPMFPWLVTSSTHLCICTTRRRSHIPTRLLLRLIMAYWLWRMLQMSFSKPSSVVMMMIFPRRVIPTSFCASMKPTVDTLKPNFACESSPLNVLFVRY